MSNIWKPRPPSFPPDERIPYTAAEVNEFEDLQDLHINDNERKQSEDEIELDSINKSKLFRARDSVFVRQKQRTSVISLQYDDNESDSYSPRNVSFKPNFLSPNNGVDNEVFESDSIQGEEVVLRRKTATNTFSKNDFNMADFEEFKE